MRIALAILLALVIPVRPALAQYPPQGDHLLDFVIVRNGAEIGYHRIRFARQGETLHVDIDVNVRVNALFVTVYRFSHQSRELWERGRLVHLDAETDDDGTPHHLSIGAQGDELVVTHNGATTRVAGDQIPTSLWNRAALERPVILGTLRGDLMPTQVTRLGPSTVDVGGGSVVAEGYLIDAKPDFKRWVWFDDTGRLVAVRLLGRDGSQVSYRLR
jgi:hypothetical protein